MTKSIKPSEFAAIVKRDVERYRSAAVSALYDEAVRVINKSIPVTPLDTGDLRRSAFVSKPTPIGNSVEVELGYGGFASKYALFVHEMGVKSKKKINWKEPGTGAKYLEKPFNAATRGQAKRLQANAMRKFLTGHMTIVYTANTEPK